ncbi:hypothetical protein BT69DRAFT_1221852 [Atractiella rhizophila]|nr:hypothetical protein BT69DRAFT_1221852 [Atractiella rhizophila]
MLGNRSRANSYDAPHQQGAPNQPGEKATLVQLIPSEAQVDGLVPSESRRQDQQPRSPTNRPSIEFSGPYGNPGLNASAPVLQTMYNSVPPSRAATTPTPKKNISFATHLSFHTTWPATMYDRKSEPGTCAHLTPALAQRIKEELNAFKMEEMEVHHMSRCYTHFFVRHSFSPTSPAY